MANSKKRKISTRDNSKKIIENYINNKNKYLNIGLKYKVRNRKTISDFEWVESLKSFTDNQIVIKFIYDMEIDLFY